MKIEKSDQLTREGMADVRANRVADHRAVQAWAESLDSNNPLPAPSTKKAAQEAASSKSDI
ncbi:MAG: hypothetical protein P8166_15685 [Candidatus Thiodiazotropha sp.]|jgi:hypothetical protein